MLGWEVEILGQGREARRSEDEVDGSSTGDRDWGAVTLADWSIRRVGMRLEGTPLERRTWDDRREPGHGRDGK